DLARAVDKMRGHDVGTVGFAEANETVVRAQPKDGPQEIRRVDPPRVAERWVGDGDGNGFEFGDPHALPFSVSRPRSFPIAPRPEHAGSRAPREIAAKFALLSGGECVILWRHHQFESNPRRGESTAPLRISRQHGPESRGKEMPRETCKACGRPKPA